MQEKELLRKLGEETIYSATCLRATHRQKGHFKACDLRRQLVTYTIWLCATENKSSACAKNAHTTYFQNGNNCREYLSVQIQLSGNSG